MTVLQCLERGGQVIVGWRVANRCLLSRAGTVTQGVNHSLTMALVYLCTTIVTTPSGAVAADPDEAAAPQHEWPWTPLTRPQVPTLKGSDNRHPIDVFLQSRVFCGIEDHVDVAHVGLKPYDLRWCHGKKHDREKKTTAESKGHNRGPD